MTQQVYDPIDPVPTSGVLLAALLNGLRLSLLSNNAANSRPSYAQAGTGWLNISASPWVYNIFDGTHDLPLFDINPTTGVMRLYHAGFVLGALAVKNTIGSSDIDAGAIVTAALGTKVVTQAKLGDASVGAAQIKTAEKVAILAALLGTAVNGRVVKGNGTTFEVALPQVSVASDDAAPGFLGTKLVAGSLFTVEVFTDAGEKKVRVKLSDGTPNHFIGFDALGTPAILPPPSSGIIVSRVVFNASGTYTKPADLLYVDVEVVGGGGGGAGSYNTNAVAANGNGGGTSSFGSHCTSGGGGGGGGGGSVAHGAGGGGGGGGGAVGGDLNAPGNKGGSGSSGMAGGGSSTISGYGLGGSGGAGFSTGYIGGGGGGGGGYSRKVIDSDSLSATETVTVGVGGARGSNGSPLGVAGTQGVVIVTEYRSA